MFHSLPSKHKKPLIRVIKSKLSIQDIEINQDTLRISTEIYSLQYLEDIVTEFLYEYKLHLRYDTKEDSTNQNTLIIFRKKEYRLMMWLIIIGLVVLQIAYYIGKMIMLLRDIV